MLINCLAFAEKFKCKGNIDKDREYMVEVFEPTLKKIDVAFGLRDKKMLREEKKNLKKVKKTIDHMLKEHFDVITFEEIAKIVKFKNMVEELENTIENVEKVI